MLGRAYKALERYPEAIKALAEANRRKPGNTEILLEYAEAIAQGSGSLAGEPVRLLEQVLKIEPDNVKALTLAGGAAFEAGQYDAAIARWQRVVAQVPADSELGRALAAGIERARVVAAEGSGTQPAAGKVVRGEVQLSAELKDRAPPEAAVFIFARAADGPRMPLAVIRKQVKDLPARFQLDDSMAMNAQAKLSAAAQVIVTARVSQSGSAAPRSGDLEGESKPVAPGTAEVKLTIDKVLP